MMRCSCCSSSDVVAVEPGFDEIRSETGMLVKRGKPTRMWCVVDWPALGVRAPNVFAQIARAREAQRNE